MAFGRHDALAGEKRHRIAAQQADEAEGNDRDADEGRDDERQPVEDDIGASSP